MIKPLDTLTGRMMLVTLIAVLASYAAAFAIYANERGAALRRAAETAVTERIAFTAERLRQAPLQRRESMAAQIREFGVRYSAASVPLLEPGIGAGAGARIARSVSERLNGAEVRAQTRTVERAGRWRRMLGDAPAGERRARGFVRATEVQLAIRLDAGTWLHARARLPGPRPAPFSVLAAALVGVIVVSIGAALVSRQIGRPLAQLAEAARAFGAGQAGAAAPLSGPGDVRRAALAFNAMASRLGRQMERQRHMLWALSHDLRTPLTAIRLRAELIDDEGSRQRLLASVEEMERLTEQALSLASAGASQEAPVRVDLAEIARTLCGELAGIGVTIRAEADHPVWAKCRPSEAARALRNLAENAARHGGGGVVQVYRGAPGEVVAEVTDEGAGVAPDVLSRLTAPFYRGDDARSQGGGAGLGLAIAQAIAEAQGGRLVLANRTPRGFSAKLILPST